jgi:aerobic carbon-monoxide dehydrogenase small subunit
MSEHDIALTVNGERVSARVSGRRVLADFLRDQLRLTGTHLGCEHGACGACTVLVDGLPQRSCLILAAQADGATITTVEGLAVDGQLGAVQQAFQDCHGLQCGFCTPGFVMTVTALLDETPEPTHEQVVDALSGNICRCTGYQGIVAAVARAVVLREGGAP